MAEEKIVRKKQLNISTSDMSDDVYRFLNCLAEERTLTKKVIEWATQQIRNERSRQQFEVKVYQELKLIKDMLRSGKFHLANQTTGTAVETELQPTVMKVSDATVATIIDEDVEYDDY